MIAALITFLVAALVAYVVYFILSKFLDGTMLQIVAIIIGLVLLLFALKIFGIVTL